jgi:hypothetical protein
MLFERTIKSYHFLNNFERSRPVFVRKEGNAAAAASIAFWVSALSSSGAVPINFPEDGSAQKTYVNYREYVKEERITYQ